MLCDLFLGYSKREQDLHESLSNGHKLVWERLVGKQAGRADYGKLWCSVCGKEWPWKGIEVSAKYAVDRCLMLRIHQSGSAPSALSIRTHRKSKPRNSITTPPLLHENTRRAQFQNKFPGTGLVLPVRRRIVGRRPAGDAQQLQQQQQQQQQQRSSMPDTEVRISDALTARQCIG